MANPFLNNDNRDIETAILLEKAYQHDIGKAVAYTDGDRVFINTDDNLFNILPAYDHNMLKWLLWHEDYHKQLSHHNRFFRYLRELDEKRTMDEFQVTKEEVNIIMDILVHDSLCRMFPELIETAINNLAQLRNRNSLGYTFKSFVLEDMLQEYADFKRGVDKDSKDSGAGDEGDEGEETDGKGKGETKDSKSKDKDEDKEKEPPKDSKGSKDDKTEKAHGEGGSGGETPSGRGKDGAPEMKDTSAPEPEPESEHDKTDWSKLDDIDSKEFIKRSEGDHYVDQINKLKRKKFRLGKLTQTLNGLATTTRQRSYAMPSTIHVGKGVLLKGRTPGKTNLYLCFDASGSMGREMETFKEIISKSIPQAMDVPTAWFSGACERIPRDPEGRNYDYYKGKFKDFMPVYANSGYDDDGDRTIELCWKAEQQGYSPIGVTDGGGCISWSRDMIMQLKRTILVGQNEHWLQRVHDINPKIQIIVV